MKTKREVLERFAEAGGCSHIRCTECEYNGICCVGKNLILSRRLQKIGAMAILRMFPEKEKPLLSAGTKIKFSDGKIATILKIIVVHRHDMNSCSLLFEDGHHTGIDYLIDRNWEIVE